MKFQFLQLPDSANPIAVYDSGPSNKPVLFFIHGLAINSLVWKYLIESLQNDFRCIAIDLPGHGESWKYRGTFSMSFYAQTVRAAIEKMGLKNITIIGHSMGGQIAILLSLQIAPLIEKLILTCSAGIEKFTADDANKINQGAAYIYREPIPVSQIMQMYQPHLTGQAARVAELAADHIRQQEAHFSLFSETVIKSVQGMLNEPVHALLSHLHQPTLVLYGTQDQLIPNRWVHPMMNMQQIVAEAKKQIRNATIELIEGAGHYLPLERVDLAADKIKEFQLRN
jgi:pimeloyl-ACP methyl ester carboxylesterase